MRTVSYSSLLVGLLLGCAVGCSKVGDQPTTPSETAPIQGTVTYQGKRLPAGLVRFMAVDSRAEALTRIQPDGSYSIHSPVGDVRIIVDTSIIKDEYDKAEERRKWYVPIPSKYAAFTETPFRKKIDGGTTKIDLVVED